MLFLIRSLESLQNIKLSIKNAESIGFDSISYIIPIIHKETDLALDCIEKGLIDPEFEKSTPVNSLHLTIEELEKIVDQLLKEALENQPITIRRLGVKVSELSEIQGQSDITSYF